MINFLIGIGIFLVIASIVILLLWLAGFIYYKVIRESGNNFWECVEGGVVPLLIVASIVLLCILLWMVGESFRNSI